MSISNDKPNQCAPNINISTHYTCFTKHELVSIAKAYNLYKTNTNKKDTNKINITNKTKKQLWRSIYNRFNKICKYEHCWIDQSFINNIQDDDLKNKLRYFTFKPKLSKNPKTWLSTNDINAVLSQYQETYDKTFKYLGALPSDFYTLVRINYQDILKCDMLGIVFNLDKHNEPGSHWVAFIIDNKKQTIEYFDSTGSLPNQPIYMFIKKFKNGKNGILENYKLLINDKIHQKKNTECGVYSIYYILQRLNGKQFNVICNNIIKDDEMKAFRKFLFRNYIA
jgi:Ulp1 family protease